MSRVDFFQFRSVSVSISIILHAGLFFRSYSGNLPGLCFSGEHEKDELKEVLEEVAEPGVVHTCDQENEDGDDSSSEASSAAPYFSRHFRSRCKLARYFKCCSSNLSLGGFL